VNVNEANDARAKAHPVAISGWWKQRHGGFESSEELEETIVKLRKKGYDAFEDYSGACSSDADGHFHAHTIKIAHLTPAQARRLLR